VNVCRISDVAVEREGAEYVTASAVASILSWSNPLRDLITPNDRQAVGFFEGTEMPIAGWWESSPDAIGGAR
jgi:hypothetical protein